MSTTSASISLTVANPPTTFVAVRSSGAGLSGTQWLDAGASSGMPKVVFQVTGGSLQNRVVATATATAYGRLAGWNIKTIFDGTYTLQSVASYPSGRSGTSAGITVHVSN